MATHQKVPGSESGSRHGSGLRTLFDLFRTQKQASARHPDEDNPGSAAAFVQETKGPKTSGFRRLGRHEKNSGPRHSALAPDSAGAANESPAPGLFTRLLRRHTKSKRSDRLSPLQHDQQQQQQHEPVRQSTLGAQIASGTRPLLAHNKRQSTASEPNQLGGYSRIDAKTNQGEHKRHSQVYVPTQAAAAFARLPVPRSLKDRYSSLVDEQDARKLAQVLPPPPELDGSGNMSLISDDSYRDEHRRLTAATLEGSSHIGSESSFVNDIGLNNTLQPPPTASRRQHNRHSYVLTQDPTSLQILEEPEETGEPLAEEPSTEESSDYQSFLQQALDKDRLETAQLWRSMSTRAGRPNITPVYSDPTNPNSLQRSGTFGGSNKAKSGSRKQDNAWKRASHLSHQSRDSRTRHSYIPGMIDDLGRDTTRPETKERHGALKRLSDYYKPPRTIIPKQPEEKRLSQIALR